MDQFQRLQREADDAKTEDQARVRAVVARFEQQQPEAHYVDFFPPDDSALISTFLSKMRGRQGPLRCEATVRYSLEWRGGREKRLNLAHGWAIGRSYSSSSGLPLALCPDGQLREESYGVPVKGHGQDRTYEGWVPLAPDTRIQVGNPETSLGVGPLAQILLRYLKDYGIRV